MAAICSRKVSILVHGPPRLADNYNSNRVYGQRLQSTASYSLLIGASMAVVCSCADIIATASQPRPLQLLSLSPGRGVLNSGACNLSGAHWSLPDFFTFARRYCDPSCLLVS